MQRPFRFLFVSIGVAVVVTGCKGPNIVRYTHDELVQMEEAVTEFVENPREQNDDVLKRLNQLILLPRQKAQEIVLNNIQHRFNLINDFGRVVPQSSKLKFNGYLSLDAYSKSVFRRRVAALVYARLRVALAVNALQTAIKI